MSKDLPTAKKLKFIKNGDTFCCFCHFEMEYPEHLMLRCPLISMVWFTSPWQLSMEPFCDWDLKRWLEKSLILQINFIY